MPPEDEDDDLPAPAETETVDAASQEGLKKQRRRIKRAEEDAETFWHGVFKSEAGRREMFRIIGVELHAFATNFAVAPDGSPYMEAAWYHRALQDFGLQLFLRWQALDPAGVHLMLMENDPRFKPKPRRRNEPSA